MTWILARENCSTGKWSTDMNNLAETEATKENRCAELMIDTCSRLFLSCC
jgi:hypothetical protein